MWMPLAFVVITVTSTSRASTLPWFLIVTLTSNIAAAVLVTMMSFGMTNTSGAGQCPGWVARIPGSSESEYTSVARAPSTTWTAMTSGTRAIHFAASPERSTPPVRNQTRPNGKYPVTQTSPKFAVRSNSTGP